jgi:Bcr/CflA subfamily drug resistance transporter
MKNIYLLFSSVVLAICLTQFAVDIYTPSLPALAKAFGTSFKPVKWSLAIYLLSVALSSLVYGPLSEGIGRKRPLLFGLMLMIIGSIVCVSATTIHVFLMGRVLQGCGTGACNSLWRPIFRDLFSGDQLSKIGSYVGIILVFVISTAPAIGGLLQHHFGWHANFIFLLVYAVTALVTLLLFFKETSQHHHVDRLRLSYIISTYKQLLTHPIFIGMMLCSFLSDGGIFAWLTVSSILLIHGTGMSVQLFGWVMAFGGGVASMMAMLLNGKLVMKYGAHRMIAFSVMIMLLSGVLMLLLHYMVGMRAWAIIIPAQLFSFGAMFMFPNTFSIAFTPFKKISGYAGALYGGIQIAGGGILGAIASHLPDLNQRPLAMILIVLPICVAIIYVSILPKLAAQQQG